MNSELNELLNILEKLLTIETHNSRTIMLAMSLTPESKKKVSKMLENKEIKTEAQLVKIMEEME